MFESGLIFLAINTVLARISLNQKFAKKKFGNEKPKKEKSFQPGKLEKRTYDRIASIPGTVIRASGFFVFYRRDKAI